MEQHGTAFQQNTFSAILHCYMLLDSSNSNLFVSLSRLMRVWFLSTRAKFVDSADVLLRGHHCSEGLV